MFNFFNNTLLNLHSIKVYFGKNRRRYSYRAIFKTNAQVVKIHLFVYVLSTVLVEHIL